MLSLFFHYILSPLIKNLSSNIHHTHVYCNSLNLKMSSNNMWKMWTLGDFTFWLSPWLSLLAETKH